MTQHRYTGPIGYTTSLVLARILKVKENISSDRELSEKLTKIQIYREAIGIKRNMVPAHNTFNTLRSRLGPEGFVQIHQHFILQAYKTGLLIPPIPDLPNVVRDKIILIGDSTLLKAVARTKGQKDENSNWIFTDDSIAFGKSHHKHKYPVGHSAHTLIAVIGIPVVSLLAPANESDQTHIVPLLRTLRTRYPSLPFVCVILDAGYDAEELHPTGIERYYGLTKENRYYMEHNNTYMGHDNVLIHVIEHDIVATLDILYEHLKTNKWSDVLNI